MRLIDNHRQVVSSEKGAVDTSARYHQRRVQKADPSSGRQSKFKIGRPAPSGRALVQLQWRLKTIQTTSHVEITRRYGRHVA